MHPNRTLSRRGWLVSAALRIPLVVIVSLSLLPVVGLAAAAPIAESTEDAGLERLAAEVERLAAAAQGRVGVGILHLESGRQLVLEGGVPFPMASTYKVPIAVEILTRVDAGELQLDQLLTVSADDIVDTHGPIRNYLFVPGAQLSVRHLLELMLRESDNIATDLLLELAGGGDEVTRRMRASGVEGLRVDRSTRWIIANWLGREGGPDRGELSPAEFDALVDPTRLASLQPSELAELNEAFNQDPRDTSTPEAMTELLRGLWSGEILSEESTSLLIDIMIRCATGEGRLKGALPPGTRVGHKTGTIGQTTNDVGVIELPDGAGHVVCVVFIMESEIPEYAAREPVIAEIARAVHDYFVFQGSS